MTISEIDRLELTIRKKLPDWYKDFLLNYPDDLVNLGAPYNTVSELSLPNKVNRLIEISDFEDAPDNVLVIGVDGIGNCYYIILDNNDTTIYRFDHEAPVFLDDNEEEIDWRESYDLSFMNLDELVLELRERLIDETEKISKSKTENNLHHSAVFVTIECEMKDKMLINRNLEVADIYPIPKNTSEIAKSLKIKTDLGYSNDVTITYTFLVSVDKSGKPINVDFQGGDNIRVVDDVTKNIIGLKFEPAIKNETPVDSYILVNYKFNLK